MVFDDDDPMATHTANTIVTVTKDCVHRKRMKFGEYCRTSKAGSFCEELSTKSRSSTPVVDTVITDGSTPHTSLKPLPTEEWCRAEIMERADAVLNRTGGNYGVPMFEIDIKHCLITGKPEASVYGD
jgi:hypothetical protein